MVRAHPIQNSHTSANSLNAQMSITARQPCLNRVPRGRMLRRWRQCDGLLDLERRQNILERFCPFETRAALPRDYSPPKIQMEPSSQEVSHDVAVRPKTRYHE